MTLLSPSLSNPELPTILLVDDEEDFVELGTRLLERAGISNPVAVASGGGQAIEYLKLCCERGERKPGLILLDIDMPVVNGFEVLRWLRSMEAFANVKVVMLTASADPEDQQRAAEMGADAYVVKFPSPLVFGCLIRTALAQTNEHTGSSAS